MPSLKDMDSVQVFTVRFAKPHFACPAGLALLLGLALALAGCGGKSEAQLAVDALNAGLAAQAAGNLEEAKTHYSECLKHDATNKVCLYDLGVVAQTQNQPTAAENYYRLALASDPNYPPALFNLAILRTSEP